MSEQIKDQETSEEVQKLKEALEKCEKERAEYLDGWKRAKADYINYKKEEAARLESLLKFSNEALIKELISVLDSFDMSFAVLPDNDPARKGMLLIKNQLEDLLKKYGLERIQSPVGKLFDPAEEEAVGEAESNLPAGQVVEEIMAGYKLSGRVIRPSRVKISKGPKKSE
jgi:molecular chaperone GrpE